MAIQLLDILDSDLRKAIYEDGARQTDFEGNNDAEWAASVGPATGWAVIIENWIGSLAGKIRMPRVMCSFGPIGPDDRLSSHDPM